MQLRFQLPGSFTLGVSAPPILGVLRWVGRGFLCWSQVFPAYGLLSWVLYPLWGFLKDYGGLMFSPRLRRRNLSVIEKFGCLQSDTLFKWALIGLI